MFSKLSAAIAFKGNPPGTAPISEILQTPGFLPPPMPHTFERALGALLGQCSGDALGCRYNFRSSEDVKQQIETDKDDSDFLPIRGSAVFEFPPGQYCMLIARSLSRNGSIDVPDIIDSIVRWKRSDPVGTHNPVFDVLDLGTENEDPRLTGIWLEKKITLSALLKNKNSLSNMCLNFATPVAISTVNSTNENFVVRLTKLTQPHPAAQDAVRVLTLALKSLILCPDVQLAYSTAVSNAKTDLIRSHLQEAKKRAHPQTETNLEEDELPIHYLGITLQIAFHQLLHAESFSSGVIEAISLGGDTTNNAAITGALLGARFGVSGIPSQWKDTVIQPELDRHKVFPDVKLDDMETLVKRLLHKLSL
ncbi:hypothetical protein FO519_001244 [Halicephalobus sp. NKZ332]|nr:hypothetical protein FO519_001244 [Halicephalobus sp. NKZ332]